MPNETQEQFLQDLEQDPSKNPLEQPLDPDATAEQAPAEEEEDPKSRRERRLTARLQAERESSIALAARLEAITEAQRFREESEPSEYLKSVERIYGTGTPEAVEATELLKSALRGAKDEAKAEAIAAIREEQVEASEAVSVEERNLDDMVDELEDAYGVTIDGATSQGFFQLLERMSPKDRNGDIIEYADPFSVWESYQSSRAKSDTRAKDLASRSMVRTGASAPSTVQQDSTERFLRDNGII